MKKLIFIFGLLALVAMIACTPKEVTAQERTVTVNDKLPNGVYYAKYTGTAADTLKATNQDTIDVVFYYQSPQYVHKIAVKTRFNIIVGADTTVSTSVFGKEFSDDATYVSVIAAATSSAVTANNTVQILTVDPYFTEAAYTFGADSVTAAHVITPFDYTYRYYRVRYILQGNDAVGTGIKIDEIEFRLYIE